MGAGWTPASGFQFLPVTFLSQHDEIDDANSEQPLSDAPEYLLQYFAKQSVDSSVIVSKSCSKEMEKTIASFFY